ncbi:hypothetical protein BDD43_3362 [Mucilaginibacter gracilis]|uniref:Uncharacterized protein n=1 Tax=Mucilaginibacter gracilis TaxID=423350 RepID=A0A495J2H2_9SPHI|nr:hypothetical protein BDD43_3362 [Mucilaginibacter gracilis]
MLKSVHKKRAEYEYSTLHLPMKNMPCKGQYKYSYTFLNCKIIVNVFYIKKTMCKMCYGLFTRFLSISICIIPSTMPTLGTYMCLIAAHFIKVM